MRKSFLVNFEFASHLLGFSSFDDILYSAFALFTITRTYSIYKMLSNDKRNKNSVKGRIKILYLRIKTTEDPKSISTARNVLNSTKWYLENKKKSCYFSEKKRVFYSFILRREPTFIFKSVRPILSKITLSCRWWHFTPMKIKLVCMMRRFIILGNF